MFVNALDKKAGSQTCSRKCSRILKFKYVHESSTKLLSLYKGLSSAHLISDQILNISFGIETRIVWLLCNPTCEYDFSIIVN